MSDNGLETYRILVNLWASGSRDYLRLVSGYLTANSVLIASIALILRMKTNGAYLVSKFFAILGIIICIQMYVAAGRLRAQNGYWERNLRIIEDDAKWERRKLFKELYGHREHQKTLPLEDGECEFEPNWAIKHHRSWWAGRMKLFPWIFGALYLALIVYSVWYLLPSIVKLICG